MSYLKQILKTVKTVSPILYRVVLLHFMLAIVCIVGLFIDNRTLMGINIWVKPLKFAISIAIYILTQGFLITLYPFSKRKKNMINNITSFTLLIEMGVIFYQASRGVQSHYNNSSPFDGILFGVMGLMISINVLIMVLFIIETIRLKLNTTKAIQWAIFLGWIIVIAGSWIGSQMINQLSHNVGVPDGGQGLPLVNWSTIGGDLRIAHFFSLHAIQIIPIFAFMLSKKWKNSGINQIIAVTVFGVLFASWIAFTFYQAKQGFPLIS